MNGHERRRQKIVDHIQHSALGLFTTCGFDDVSMEAIAAGAHVSKVTIYKYFQSKAALHREVMELYIDEILAATEKVVDSDLDFMEKLKFTLAAKLNAPTGADGQALFDVLDQYGQTEAGRQAGLKTRIKAIMFRFFEQGKRQGYIEASMPFELLYLYSEIFEAGVKAKAVDVQPILADPVAFDQLLQLYYFGVFRRA